MEDRSIILGLFFVRDPNAKQSIAPNDRFPSVSLSLIS